MTSQAAQLQSWARWATRECGQNASPPSTPLQRLPAWKSNLQSATLLCILITPAWQLNLVQTQRALTAVLPLQLCKTTPISSPLAPSPLLLPTLFFCISFFYVRTVVPSRWMNEWMNEYGLAKWFEALNIGLHPSHLLPLAADADACARFFLFLQLTAAPARATHTHTLEQCEYETHTGSFIFKEPQML